MLMRCYARRCSNADYYLLSCYLLCGVPMYITFNRNTTEMKMLVFNQYVLLNDKTRLAVKRKFNFFLNFWMNNFNIFTACQARIKVAQSHWTFCFQSHFIGFFFLSFYDSLTHTLTNVQRNFASDTCSRITFHFFF
jgi:hypothetical protein